MILVIKWLGIPKKLFEIIAITQIKQIIVQTNKQFRQYEQ